MLLYIAKGHLLCKFAKAFKVPCLSLIAGERRRGVNPPIWRNWGRIYLGLTQTRHLSRNSVNGWTKKIIHHIPRPLPHSVNQFYTDTTIHNDVKQWSQ